ncbi:uncharacterized protein LOC111701422 [Eurytemora carolleeae]|uniref:uncharacterized protein LOC111701422 n=1 Tax=Eurytemora carolleeae TaxID=1294199 RepID=UPI000C78D32E|nr:uncharacterized protein LOC111701422 [Eurytemora carolleeae]|eukprot:XP_023328471.1 uncharacterized protein LOC111701422 [Eurytemora affinis]
MERKSHHQSTGNIYSSQTLEKSSKVLRGSTSDIYRVPQTAKYNRSRDIYASSPKTISRESDISANYNQGEIYRTTQREAHSSSKPKEIYATPVSKEVYATPISKQIYATPHSNDIYGIPASKELFSRRQQSHRIVYSTESPTGSPSTKYRTKIVLNGGLE